MEGRSEGRRGVNTIRMRHVSLPDHADLGTVLKSISRDRKRREGGLVNRRVVAPVSEDALGTTLTPHFISRSLSAQLSHSSRAY